MDGWVCDGWMDVFSGLPAPAPIPIYVVYREKVL